jgi:hypothetical protein
MFLRTSDMAQNSLDMTLGLVLHPLHSATTFTGTVDSNQLTASSKGYYDYRYIYEYMTDIDLLLCTIL